MARALLYATDSLHIMVRTDQFSRWEVEIVLAPSFENGGILVVTMESAAEQGLPYRQATADEFEALLALLRQAPVVWSDDDERYRLEDGQGLQWTVSAEDPITRSCFLVDGNWCAIVVSQHIVIPPEEWDALQFSQDLRQVLWRIQEAGRLGVAALLKEEQEREEEHWRWQEWERRRDEIIAQINSFVSTLERALQQSLSCRLVPSIVIEGLVELPTEYQLLLAELSTEQAGKMLKGAIKAISSHLHDLEQQHQRRAEQEGIDAFVDSFWSEYVSTLDATGRRALNEAVNIAINEAEDSEEQFEALEGYVPNEWLERLRLGYQEWPSGLRNLLAALRERLK